MNSKVLIKNIVNEDAGKLVFNLDKCLKEKINNRLAVKKMQIVSEVFGENDSDFTNGQVCRNVTEERKNARLSVFRQLSEELNESEMEEGMLDRWLNKSKRTHAAAVSILKSTRRTKVGKEGKLEPRRASAAK